MPLPNVRSIIDIHRALGRVVRAFVAGAIPVDWQQFDNELEYRASVSVNTGIAVYFDNVRLAQ
jgi:hypothetical protein